MAQTLTQLVPLVLVATAAYLAVALPVASFLGRLLASASAPPRAPHRLGAGFRPLDRR